MMNLNDREKKLGIVTLVVLVLALGMWVNKRNKVKERKLQSELFTVQKKVAELSVLPDPSQRVRMFGKKVTLALLKNVTLPSIKNNIQVTGINQTSFSTYTVEVKCEFKNMMRFISYLERPGGQFHVSRGKLDKQRTFQRKTKNQKGWNIQGTIFLSAKGQVTS